MVKLGITQSATTRRTGFTLIELLVVMSIISLLISLLLPALSGARRTGQRVACLATLRNIAQGAAAYSTDNDDAILGAPGTSGCALLKTGVNGQPQQRPSATGHLVQRWDFMGPLAQQWGLPIPEADGTINSVKNRFNATRGDNAFLCKANGFLATYYKTAGSIDAKTGRMVSYNTARYQLFIAADSAASSPFPCDSAGVSWIPPDIHPEAILPKGWKPSATRIGVPANKVFCSDGSRFATVVPSQGPDYDLGTHAAWGGSFSDTGAFTTFSRSHDRSMAPGSGGSVPSGGREAREFAFRHSTGAPPPGAAGNAFKINLVFHDGHAETQGDLTASNPHQWLPKDASVSSGGIGSIWADTRAQFGLSSGFTIGP